MGLAVVGVEFRGSLQFQTRFPPAPKFEQRFAWETMSVRRIGLYLLGSPSATQSFLETRRIVAEQKQNAEINEHSIIAVT
jgi:hypothetical protein